MNYEDIARVAHEVNRAYCRALGDHSQSAWGNAPEWQKQSALQGVRVLAQDHSVTPEEIHESWMQLKISEGWAYGPEKRADLKRHPCLVPYNELPFEQRLKDHLFRTIVLELLRIEGT